MAYLSELRANFRALLSALLGTCSGMAPTLYIGAIFAPFLLAEFGWSRSEFALVGTASLVFVVLAPIGGRLADMFGVRRVAAFGVVTYPLTYLAVTMMSGAFTHYFALSLLLVLCGVSTSFYTRIIAERFVAARGLALTIIASTPALIGAIAGPLLHALMEAHGWRAGYYAVAAYYAIVGPIALLMIPKATQAPNQSEQAALSKASFSFLARSRPFWLMAGGMVLCNLPASLGGAQLALMLRESNQSAATAAAMVSVFASGMVVGRLICGVTLDRFAPHIVAMITMILPALGILLIASPLDQVATITLAIAMMGLATGAEADLIPFLIARYFPLEVYNTGVGLVFAAMGVSAAGGAVLLSITLATANSFTPFLLMTGVAVIVGSLFFLGLGPSKPMPTAGSEAPATT